MYTILGLNGAQHPCCKHSLSMTIMLELTFSCKVHLLSQSVPDSILVGCLKSSEDYIIDVEGRGRVGEGEGREGREGEEGEREGEGRKGRGGEEGGKDRGC